MELSVEDCSCGWNRRKDIVPRRGHVHVVTVCNGNHKILLDFSNKASEFLPTAAYRQYLVL